MNTLLWIFVGLLALTVCLFAAGVMWIRLRLTRRAHLRRREEAQMQRRRNLVAETEARLAAGERARRLGITGAEAAEGARRAIPFIAQTGHPAPTKPLNLSEIVHVIADGEAVTSCCGRTPFELPRMDRITVDPKLGHGCGEQSP